MSDYAIPPWIRKGFACRYGLRRRALQNLRTTYGACRPTGLSVALAKVAARSGDLGRWYVAAPHGLHITHPFLDPRLLRFCLGMHARVEPTPSGRRKAILSEAMRGTLPDAIRLRPKGGSFNEPYFRGLARALPGLEQFIQEVSVDDLELIDKPALLQCLRRAALGIGRDVAGVDRLNLTLALLKWLHLQRTATPPAVQVKRAFLPWERHPGFGVRNGEASYPRQTTLSEQEAEWTFTRG
jgi:asparagine synthase (glutamine-hydrolysing)